MSANSEHLSLELKLKKLQEAQLEALNHKIKRNQSELKKITKFFTDLEIRFKDDGLISGEVVYENFDDIRKTCSSSVQVLLVEDRDKYQRCLIELRSQIEALKQINLQKEELKVPAEHLEILEQNKTIEEKKAELLALKETLENYGLRFEDDGLISGNVVFENLEAVRATIPSEVNGDLTKKGITYTSAKRNEFECHRYSYEMGVSLLPISIAVFERALWEEKLKSAKDAFEEAKLVKERPNRTVKSPTIEPDPIMTSFMMSIKNSGPLKSAETNASSLDRKDPPKLQ